MKVTINKSGYSLIEVLIYIAILAIMGTILTGYFMVAINSEAEHKKRNDLALSVQNIVTNLRLDLAKATGINDPLLSKATSSVLELIVDGNFLRYEIDSEKRLNKKYSTTTIALLEPSVEVSDILFTRRDHFENRLNATTTSIEASIILQNISSKKMIRSVNITLLMGKDSL